MTACTTCPTLHPNRDPDWPEKGQLCAPDYGLITSWLRSIPTLHATAVNGDPLPADNRTTWRLRGAHLGAANLVEEPAEPIAHLLPVGPIRGASTQPRVHSTGERTLGVPIAPLEALLPVSPVLRYRTGPAPTDTLIPQIRAWTTTETVTVDGEEATVTVWHRELVRYPNGTPVLVPAGDQTGPPPPAIWLDRTAQTWLAYGAPGRRLPTPQIPILVEWLLRRLDWAADNHPELDTFTAGLRQVRHALRLLAGDLEPADQLILGVRCRRCATMSTLIKKADWTECENCGQLYTDEQRQKLATEQAKTVKQAHRNTKVPATVDTQTPCLRP